jgi:hypothetical protein
MRDDYTSLDVDAMHPGDVIGDSPRGIMPHRASVDGRHVRLLLVDRLAAVDKMIGYRHPSCRW